MPPETERQTAARIVVATTVALSFISFWRAAAIVLSDLASSAFYAGGIAEQAIGASAPWFILGVMFFSFAVRSVYMESCSMFVRGGVYVVVRDAMGPFMARLSVSALIFDYILTGPISSVSAGPVPGAAVQRSRRNGARLGYRVPSQRLRGVLRRGGHRLFLVEQHQGHPRIERQGAAHHADHHRDGGRVPDLVPAHPAVAGPRARCPRRRCPPTCSFTDEALGWLQGDRSDRRSGWWR